DLGCGTGELTAMLAARLPDAHVEGLDSSTAMLERTAQYASARVSFRLQDIGAIEDYSSYDLVFSNAALQWVPDNEGVMARMLAQLRPGAQVAVQVPKNEAHPSHAVSLDLAREEPFRTLLGGFERWSHTLSLERYAELLYQHGFREQVCFEKIYGHELPSTADVVEWVKGTSLNSYLSRLEGEGKERFLAEYRRRLFASIGERAPYFYPFRRLLFWGQKS
ncbi:MAG: methyltransferase domain-containing protein, partial [Chloroflexi bacterium]|nr:methyltransferase domain-containing protein [Chloroflexota bacterium]